MAFVSTSTDFLFLNTATRSGRLFLPSTVGNEGRILTFKDIVGTFGQSTITISTLGRSQSFEDGTNTRVLSNAFGSYSFIASSNVWYTLGGSQINQGIYSTLQAQTVSSLTVATSSIITFSTILTEGLTQSTNTLYQRSTLLYFQSNVLGGAKVGVPLFLSNSSFSPRSAAGLGLWLDAADPSSIVFLEANVFQWRDKSQNRLTAGQFFAISSYSNNAVRFITNQGLQVSYSASENIQSGFIVCGFNNAADSNTILGSANFEGGRLFRVSRGILQTVSQSVSTILDTGYQLSSLTTYITEYVNTGSTLTHYVNGNTYASGASATYFPGLFTCIGLRNGPFEPLNGYIHEIVMYSSALSTSNRQQVEGYLAWKWNLVGSLPSNHPYKNVPP